jgi:hypothetical protein
MYMVTTSFMKILNFFEIFEIMKFCENFEILNFKFFFWNFMKTEILNFFWNFWNFEKKIRVSR